MRQTKSCQRIANIIEMFAGDIMKFEYCIGNERKYMEVNLNG
jgi:hypothetical protein